jgi:hypothetical protein
MNVLIRSVGMPPTAPEKTNGTNGQAIAVVVDAFIAETFTFGCTAPSRFLPKYFIPQ